MRQLALDLQLADFAVFASYYGGRNAVAVAALEALARQPGPAVQWLWGPSGSGRSHLLQALLAAADGRCAWLPLGDSQLEPEMLEGMGNLDLVCIDDVDRVAGDARWERRLFILCEELRAAAGRLVVTAATPPGEAGFALRDLESRLAAGPVWQLHALDDAELHEALRLRAGWRGLELSDEAAAYLLRRVRREPAALFAVLDAADKSALAAQRKLSVPFLRTVLGG